MALQRFYHFIYHFIQELPVLPTLATGWSMLMAPHAIFASIAQESAEASGGGVDPSLMTASVILGMVLTTVMIVIKIHGFIRKLQGKE